MITKTHRTTVTKLCRHFDQKPVFDGLECYAWKHEFHRLSRLVLKAIASSYLTKAATITTNLGGVGVCGETTLNHDGLRICIMPGNQMGRDDVDDKKWLVCWDKGDGARAWTGLTYLFDPIWLSGMA